MQVRGREKKRSHRAVWDFLLTEVGTISTAYIGCLGWFTKTKLKCGSPVGTAGLCGFVVLLLLL